MNQHRQQIIFSNDVAQALETALGKLDDYNEIIVLTDVNVSQFVLPRLADVPALAGAHSIAIKSGDMNKNLETATSVWKQLELCGATRRSLMINLGGGVVTDLGGFAASTFKRGLRFINMPTTLLGAVDAAIGGKTGVNFNGLKNEIGVFNEADAVIISTLFFDTLPESELKSGYAEMLKHGLLSDRKYFADLLNYDMLSGDTALLLELLKKSVTIKRDIVAADPHEQGLRRALNLGHTAGHAFESLAMQRTDPVPHGYAVAWGLVVELILSHITHKFPSDILHAVVQFVKDNYGTFHITCNDYDTLLALMRHDKKSRNGEAACRHWRPATGHGRIARRCPHRPRHLPRHDAITPALSSSTGAQQHQCSLFILQAINSLYFIFISSGKNDMSIKSNHFNTYLSNLFNIL